MAKKPKVQPGVGPVGVGAIVITGNPDGSFGFEIESDLSPEALGPIIRAAADQVMGTADRATGAWGR